MNLASEQTLCYRKLPMASTVRLYDFKTEQITEIPASELATGWIRVQLEGVDGEVFVESDKLDATGKFQHPPFDGDRREKVNRLSLLFADVFPMTSEQWEDNHRRDQNPDKELAIWERIANAYLHFTDGKSLPLNSRKDYFNVILSCANNGPDAALEVLELKTLSKARARSVVRYIRSLGA